MEGVGIFYGHLVNFTAQWYILWAFGSFFGHLVYFLYFTANWCVLRLFGIVLPFWYVWSKKNLAALLSSAKVHIHCDAGPGNRRLIWKFIRAISRAYQNIRTS
jgi:hypothetical protein